MGLVALLSGLLVGCASNCGLGEGFLVDSCNCHCWGNCNNCFGNYGNTCRS